MKDDMSRQALMGKDVGIAACILSLVYIKLKPYPMDYVDGQLLVDPVKMMNDSFKAAGAFLGFVIGSFIDRHCLPYEIPEGKKSLALMTAVGAFLLLAWKELFAPATIVPVLGGHWGNFVARFIMVFFAMVVWPYCIMKAKD